MFSLFDADDAVLYLVGEISRGGFSWQELRVYYSFQDRQYYVGVASGCSCTSFESFFASVSSFRSAGSLMGVLSIVDSISVDDGMDYSISSDDVLRLKNIIREFDTKRDELFVKFKNMSVDNVSDLLFSFVGNNGVLGDDRVHRFVSVFRRVFQGYGGNVPFRVIVAGSRDFSNYGLLVKVLDRILGRKIELGFDVKIVSGMARGADSLAIDYAGERCLDVMKYPADWDTYGKRAGYIRNQLMADNAEALVAFTNGSKGTGHMINIAKNKGLPIRIIHIDENSQYVSVEVIN